jgi:hypothetical protein
MFMRLPTLIITLAITTCSYTQSKYSSFTGGVEIGYGVIPILNLSLKDLSTEIE